MLNNDVRLIGIITSGFEDDTFNPNFPKTKFKIEVEKKYKGKYCSLWVSVLGNNRDIDTSVSLEGKAVIVNGYIDENNGYLKIVAQDMYIVGVGKPRTKKVEPPATEEPAKIETKNTENIEIPDDDLPF